MDYEISDKEIAAFECGIKLGALYHQFAGTPTSLESVEDLEKSIASSIKNQPYVVNVVVKIDRNMIKGSTNAFGYSELRGEMLEVMLTLKYRSVIAKAGLFYDEKLKYPLMKLISLDF